MFNGLLNEVKLITLTSEIVAAHVSNNSVRAHEVSALIGDVYAALSSLGKSAPADEKPEPAVAIGSSVKPDHIVCLEDGRKVKLLKRHLKTDHDLTPEQYRARWGLPAEYPMVAPEHAQMRRTIAKQMGLGRLPGQKRGRSRKAG